MSQSMSEKLFFLDNDHEVNWLVFKIVGIFGVVLLCMLPASYFDVFKVPPLDVVFIIGLLLLVEIVFYILLKCNVPVKVVKHYGLFILELCLVVMISNAYFGIYISYILPPAVSCLYFDRRLTYICVAVCYFGMLIGLWFRAPGAIELAFPGYTRVSWFIAFGLGYTLEYAALSAVLIAIARRARHYMEELHRRKEKIDEIQNKIIYRFADLVESRDETTGKHIKRTGKYVLLLCEKIRQKGPYMHQLTDDDVVNVKLAAPLHDIGKIVVPDAILLKPGKLTSDEFDVIKSHTLEGSKIVDTSMAGIEEEKFLAVARDIALSHHEKWDGSGYPNGLAGTEISLFARIMAVADVFDALVTERCYKNAVSVEEAFAILKEGRGVHFDPYLVDVFVASSDEIHKIIEEDE